MNLPEPFPVSPFIRFSRYGFLTAGIVYGLFNHARLSKKEAKFRVIDNEEKRIRNEQLAVERLKHQEMERQAIAILSR